jgi:glycosyltransferase involved in cell wall biosynthesis
MQIVPINKSLLFIGHEYHQKTKSSVFFIKILEKYFHIEYLWINNSSKFSNCELLNDFNTIIFWQIIVDVSVLNQIHNKNLVFIPMYDGMGAYQRYGNLNYDFWQNFEDFKFINFSKYVDKNLKQKNFKNTIQIQYAESKYNIKLQKNKKKYKLFFWQRRNEITWNELRQLIDPAQIESIHIHKSVDPNMTFVEPTEEDMRNYNITFSEWFETKEEYLKKVKDCDIYVSPRLYEGIGMSFLEAMSLGKCIIAPNFPTMNEYIVNNENGLLYDIKNLKKLDLSKANDLGFNAYKTIEEISKIWKQSEQKIIDFIIQEKQILEPQKKNIIKQKEDKNFNIYKSIEKVCSLSFFKSPIKKYKAYKSMLKTFHIEKNKFKQKQNEKGKIRKVLIVFPHNPFLLQNGVQTRFYELIKYFNKISYSVDILSHTNFVDKWDEKHINHKFINKVYFNDFKQSKSQGNLNNSVLPNFAFNSLQEQIEKLHTTQNYDLLLMSYVHWANVAKNLNNIKKYIMIEDFISMNNYERSNGKYNLGQSINEEIERINLFDKAICISKEEANFFERACKDVEFHHIPHFLESKFSENKKDTDIVFVGSDNPFNRDGMIWFFEYVMPHLNDIYKIKIIGRVNEHLEKYKNRFKNIEFISYVKNLDDIYSKSKVSICPLQGGTGLKIKVVESLSYGVPIVCTKYGVVGMDSKYNGCLVVDEAQEFANEIRSLLKDEQKYKNLQNEAKEYFVENFSKESVYKKLDIIF